MKNHYVIQKKLMINFYIDENEINEIISTEENKGAILVNVLKTDKDLLFIFEKEE